MAEPIQVISAALGLFTCAVKTAKLIHEVIEAKTEAGALHHKTTHLQKLAQNIYRVLKVRQAQGTLPPPVLLESIEDSLRKCTENVSLLKTKLEPLTLNESHSVWRSLRHRLNHIISKEFIRDQNGLIGTYVSILTLDFVLLNNLDQSALQSCFRGLVSVLGENAGEAQADLLRPLDDEDLEKAARAETAETIETDMNEEALEEESASTSLDFNNVCPECHKRNEIVPDKPLAIAVKYRQADHVYEIMQVDDADLDVRDPEGWTLLHHAAHNDDLEIVKIILQNQKGKNLIDDMTQQHQTALMLVSERVEVENSLEIARTLIDSGCNLNIQDHGEPRRSALYFAVEGPKTVYREEFVNFLSEAGSELVSVRKGLEDKFKHYPLLEERFQKEDIPEEKPSRDGLGRRLSRALSWGS